MVTLLMAGDAMAARARSGSGSDSDEGRSAKRVKPTKMVTIYIYEQEGVDGAGAPIWGEKEAVKAPADTTFGTWRANIKAERHGVRLAQLKDALEDVIPAEEIPAGTTLASLVDAEVLRYRIYK